jgi:ferritin-like metal-binding protein YciE
MDTVAELFQDEIKDIYSAEKQLTKALPKMAKKATTESLKQAFTTHLDQTKGHIARLEEIGRMLEFKLTGKTCAAMKGLVEEGKEILDEEDPSPITDAALIGAAQRVEHYEIAAYGTVCALAKVLGHSDALKLLTETLNEEKETDKLLTKIAEREVLPEALAGEESEEAEEDEEEVEA